MKRTAEEILNAMLEECPWEISQARQLYIIEAIQIGIDQSKPASIGVELIGEERQRQVDVEGYNIERDRAQYVNGELAGAAGCYVANSLNKNPNEIEARFEVKWEEDGVDLGYADAWPWDSKDDKREKHDQLRSLVIAGALIAAEIERLLPSPERKEDENV